MTYLIIGLIVLGVVAFVAGFFREKKLKRQLEKGEITELPSIKQVEDMECCGQHETCEKESLLAAVSKQIEYYNDEELDRFRGRESDGYSKFSIRCVMMKLQDGFVLCSFVRWSCPMN